MKKIILLLLFTSLGWQQAQAQNFTSGGLNYSVTSGTTVQVAYQGDQVTGTITIPSQVNYAGTVYTVTRIDQLAFQSCRALISLTMPNTVTSIGDTAFKWCESLTSIAISNTLTSIGVSVFEHCNSLTSVTIPNSVTSIGEIAFYDCTSLTSVIIPNSVTSIGNAAFSYNSNLTSVTIPNSVTSIGEYAFVNCKSLTSVICNVSTPININDSVFGSVNQAACSLTVPAASVAAYRAANVWKNFAPINGSLANPSFEAMSLQLYPIPAKTTLYIQSSNNRMIDKITITDLTGKIVATQTTNTNQVDVERLSSGMYSIQAVAGDTKFVRKFIKE